MMSWCLKSFLPNKANGFFIVKVFCLILAIIANWHEINFAQEYLYSVYFIATLFSPYYNDLKI